jgi:hypothetical protein
MIIQWPLLSTELLTTRFRLIIAVCTDDSNKCFPIAWTWAITGHSWSVRLWPLHLQIDSLLSFPIIRPLPKPNIIYHTPFHVRNNMSVLECVCRPSKYDPLITHKQNAYCPHNTNLQLKVPSFKIDVIVTAYSNCFHRHFLATVQHL